MRRPSGPPHLLTVLAIVAALAILGCADDDPSAEPDATSSETTAAGPASTEPTESSTTAPGPLYFPTGEEAMEHLVEAWQAGDEGEAARVAAPDAVNSLFNAPPEGYAKYGACGTAEFGQQLCTYRNRSVGGFIQFQMAEQPEGWNVEAVTVDQAG